MGGVQLERQYGTDPSERELGARPYLSPCGRESDFNTLARSEAKAKC